MEQVSVVASVGVNKLKETIQVKNKNHLRPKLTTCVLLLRKKQKELSREMFSASQAQRLSNQSNFILQNFAMLKTKSVKYILQKYGSIK